MAHERYPKEGDTRWRAITTRREDATGQFNMLYVEGLIREMYEIFRTKVNDEERSDA